MDCCDNNYHRYHYHQQPSSMMRSAVFHQHTHPLHYQYPPHYHHHSMGVGGYFAPPVPPCYGATYEAHTGGDGAAAAAADMYHHHHSHVAHHGPDYYSHQSDPSDYSGAASYAGNAPFHMTSPYYHHHHHPQQQQQQPLHINGAASINGWNSQSGGDYVYNPKEARIRKALRDATREKMLGVGTGLAPNSAQQRPSGGGQRRLAQPWMLPDQDDHIMMSPSEPSGPGGGALRAGMASPMCGTGFPMSIAPMGSYASPMHHPHAAYINNPLAQLQQQTDLWNPYHHKSQTKSPQEAPYLMSPHHHHHHHMSVSSPYTSHVPPNLPPPMTFSPSHPDDNKAVDDLIDNTTTIAPLNSAPTDHMVTTQSSNSTVPTITAKMEQPETPPEQQHEETALLGGRVDTMRSGEDVVNGHGKIEMVEFDSCNGGGESSTDLIKIVSTSPDFEHQQEKIVLQNPFDIPPSAVAINNVSAYHNHQQQQRKKSINQKYQQHMMHQQQPTTFPSSSSSSSSCATQHRNTTCYHHHPHQVAKEPPVKPLPDFNEAFGGTERGRYQSPPNNTRMLPILSQSKSDCVDFLGFFGNDNMKLEDYHI